MYRVVPLCCALALVLPVRAHAYDWPVKPFGVQHPVRGYFDDPRREKRPDGRLQESFHSGIDISAPDGTAVYAIESGRVSLRRGAVVVTSAGEHVFGYWHVRPAVLRGTYVFRHQLIGRIERGRGHVHLSESVGGVYLNPLRPDALAPYGDRTPPTVADAYLSAHGVPVDPSAVGGTVDLIAEAFDTPPLAPSPPFAQTRVTPALIRWRVVGLDGRIVIQWRTAIDFREHLLPSPLFAQVYAPGTIQNHANRPGDYRFYLARGWNTGAVPDGLYLLQIEAFDTRGNRGSRQLPFRIANQSS